MPNTLQIKRGLQVNLPTGIAGELLFTTDTKRVYIGDGATNNLLQGASSILTTGMVSFSDSLGKLTGSSSLYWDNTNGFLGIGTSTPSTKLHVVGSEITFAVASGAMNFYNTPGANSHFNFINSRQDSDYIFKQNRNGVANSTSLVLKGLTGNVLINTTTDAGYKLDVNGTARVSDLTIGTPSVDNNVRFGGNNTRIFNSISDNSLNYQSVFSSTTVHRFTTNSTLPNANTSGTNVFMSLPIGFAPTSGTATWTQLSMTPTINQTGGANGITRGLYINPNLIAAADFRAIETTNGKVIFGNLPTSPVGLPTGAIWNNLGILSIV